VVEAGAVTIVPIVDAEGSFATFREVFPDASPGLERATRRSAPEAFDGERWVLPFHCFLVERPETHVLVDTGVGPRGGDFLPEAQERLRDAVDPESIDLVVFTHLHVDHVGWNALDGDPFFPRARYVSNEQDWNWFLGREARRELNEAQLRPLERAGVLELVAGGEVAPGVRLLPTPGHTPGHSSVVVDEKLVLLGDVVVHPVQLVDPAVRYVSDADHERARTTRVETLQWLAGEQLLVGVPHFFGAFGRIRREGASFRFEPGGPPS
jgi:glyoxylase-like metal-dependent hydrolase (beta-lactamase superfamily II)